MFTHQYSAADAETILSGGCASFLYLPGQNNYQENKELSQRFGSRAVVYDGEELIKPVITADETFTLKGKGIFVHSGNRPALLRMYPPESTDLYLMLREFVRIGLFVIAPHVKYTSWD